MILSKKISILIRGVLFALLIGSLVPSVASACGNSAHKGSSCSGSTNRHNNCSGCNQGGGTCGQSADFTKFFNLAKMYQNKATSFLHKYQSSFCYSDYMNYLNYARQANYYKNKYLSCKGSFGCNSCNNGSSCGSNNRNHNDRYVTLAEKYLECATKYKAYAQRYYNLYNGGCSSWSRYTYYAYYLCYTRYYNYYISLYNEFKNYCGNDSCDDDDSCNNNSDDDDSCNNNSDDDDSCNNNSDDDDSCNNNSDDDDDPCNNNSGDR